jgi:hypothetical protein
VYRLLSMSFHKLRSGERSSPPLLFLFLMASCETNAAPPVNGAHL